MNAVIMIDISTSKYFRGDEHTTFVLPTLSVKEQSPSKTFISSHHNFLGSHAVQKRQLCYTLAQANEDSTADDFPAEVSGTSMEKTGCQCRGAHIDRI